MLAEHPNCRCSSASISNGEDDVVFLGEDRRGRFYQGGSMYSVHAGFCGDHNRSLCYPLQNAVPRMTWGIAPVKYQPILQSEVDALNEAILRMAKPSVDWSLVRDSWNAWAEREAEKELRKSMGYFTTSVSEEMAYMRGYESGKREASYEQTPKAQLTQQIGELYSQGKDLGFVTEEIDRLEREQKAAIERELEGAVALQKRAGTKSRRFVIGACFGSKSCIVEGVMFEGGMEDIANDYENRVHIRDGVTPLSARYRSMASLRKELIAKKVPHVIEFFD